MSVVVTQAARRERVGHALAAHRGRLVSERETYNRSTLPHHCSFPNCCCEWSRRHTQCPRFTDDNDCRLCGSNWHTTRQHPLGDAG